MTCSLARVLLLVAPIPAVAPGAAGQEAKVVRLTETGARNRTPVVSPDGTRIAFGSDRSGRWQLWLMDADGGRPVRLTSRPHPVGGPSWSPDGTTVWFESRLRLFRVRVATREVVPFEMVHANAYRPVPGPDGATLLYDVAEGPDHDLWRLDLTVPGGLGPPAHDRPGIRFRRAMVSRRTANRLPLRPWCRPVSHPGVRDVC